VEQLSGELSVWYYSHYRHVNRVGHQDASLGHPPVVFIPTVANPFVSIIFSVTRRPVGLYHISSSLLIFLGAPNPPECEGSWWNWPPPGLPMNLEVASLRPSMFRRLSTPD
jgi:hypothetical protein